MNIAEAADAAGLPAKTLRYYDEIGLVIPERRENGYRRYRTVDIRKLAFFRRARSLGFSVGDCRSLLSLYEDRDSESGDVKRIANARIAGIDTRIAELASLRETLTALVSACRGDSRPDCPILDDISGNNAL